MTKFWKPLLAIALICALALAGLGLAAQSPAAAARAERADEFRAVWVATVYRLDYPSQASYRSGGPQAGRRRDFTGVRRHGHERCDSPGAALRRRPLSLRAVPVEQIPDRRTGNRPEKRL